MSFISYSALALWLLWCGFVAVMHIRRVRDQWGLTLAQKICGYPLLAVGYALDVALQITLATVVFVREPEDWTISERLMRYRRERDDWRHDLAVWIQERLLADFDVSGDHGTPGRK